MKVPFSRVLFRFTTSLVALGGLLAAGVAFDLGVRGRHRYPLRTDWHVAGTDPIRGRQAILNHGCGACHVIPGVRGATGRVGPKLEEIRHQIYLGGVLTNSPRNLAEWIRKPREFHPDTAMPDLGIGEQEARDIAAYLYSM